MSCTSADVFLYERADIPSVGVSSSGFIKQAKYQAYSHGMNDMAVMFVPHPISNCTKQEIEEKADAAYANIIKALKSNDIYREPGWQEDVKDEPEECNT